MTISEYLQCPATGASLIAADGQAVSAADNSIRYGVADGVVDFSSSSSESQEIEQELQVMIDAARAHGCIESINKYSADPLYLFDENRRFYLDLADIDKSDAVLEIGASMGQHTRFIAKRCRHVEALEVVNGQAVFGKLFCEQDGLKNVSVSAGGVNGVLPYKDASFDLVIMNYVIEWCAGRSSVRPRDFHRNMLKECRRVLRKGGRLFLSTKNRYNLRLLVGGVDEHMELPFGSALPRFITRNIMKLRRLSKPPGYLHSRSELERLLTEAGFGGFRSFLALPDARFPQFVEDLNRQGVARMKANYSGTSKRKIVTAYLSLPYFLQKQVAPSHVYIAEAIE